MSCLRASIAQVDSSLQDSVVAIEDAPTLAAMMLAVWQLARSLAVKLVEEVLAERAHQPTEWSMCEQCGARIEYKEFRPRQQAGLIGTVQRTCHHLKHAACALAVFVPFEVAAVLLALLTGVEVSPGSVWNWVQQAGAEAMARLQGQLKALTEGELPAVEPMEAEVAQLPLLVGRWRDGSFPTSAGHAQGTHHLARGQSGHRGPPG